MVIASQMRKTVISMASALNPIILTAMEILQQEYVLHPGGPTTLAISELAWGALIDCTSRAD